ncbi:MAG: sugar ABC transporter permease [Clostridia bacterium]|nr:sugar ABC transporter permease [Clostridia bacterium]
MTKKFSARKFRKSLLAYAMIAPLVFGVALFSVYPPLRGILLSFFDVQKATDPLNNFVGLQYYGELFGIGAAADQIFIRSIKTMFILQIPRFIVNVTVPFIYAELMFCVTNRKLQSVYRILVLLPIVCPGIVSQLIWMNIFATEGGLLNEALLSLGIISENVAWLSEDYIIGSLIFMGFPWLPGTSALIVLSGLLAIPGEVLEATTLDGCGTMRRVFVIDISYLIGQIKYVVVFGIINIFQDYGNQLLFAEKVGHAIDVPAYYMYYMVQNSMNLGKASAIGVFLFIVIMLITLVTYRFLNGKDEENI